MKQTVCLNCNVPFTQGRTDQMFCSDKCGSAYWKLHGTTHNHKDLPHFNAKDCKQCGNRFWYNDYADRKGKRVPTFCSTRCRVRFHRASHNAAGPERAEREHTQRGEKSHARPFKTGDFRDALHAPNRWSFDAASDWLGVPRNSFFDVYKAAFRRLNAQYHPDHNAGAVWPHLQTVNAAWDFIKRHMRH